MGLPPAAQGARGQTNVCRLLGFTVPVYVLIFLLVKALFDRALCVDLPSLQLC